MEAADINMKLLLPQNNVLCEIKYKNENVWEGRTVLVIAKNNHEFWGTLSGNLQPNVYRLDNFDYRSIEKDPLPRPEWNTTKNFTPNYKEHVVVFYDNDWSFAQYENDIWNLYENGSVASKDIKIWCRLPYVSGKGEKR